jgi:SAM-dependent methyltransferase
MSPDRDSLNKRRRIKPRIYDSSYVHCRSHLLTLKLFRELVHQSMVSPVILDVGCGSKPLKDLFPTAQYLGVDIDPNSPADFVLDCNTDCIPMAGCSVDAIVLSNTLEHIFNTGHVMAEIRRVLKPGGFIYFSVPMTFPVHAHPADYHRFTPYFFEREFSDWEIAKLEITNSVFSTPILISAQLFDTFLPVWLNSLPIILLNSAAIILDRVTRMLFHSIRGNILIKLWSRCPPEIHDMLMKVWGSCPLEINGIIKRNAFHRPDAMETRFLQQT